MQELVKQNEVLIPNCNLTMQQVYGSNLPDKTKDVINAIYSYPRIKTLDINNKDVWNRMVDLFVRIIWDAGVNMPKDEQNYLIPLMIQEIFEEFKIFTIEEVAIALRNGVRGKYGDFYGINVRSIHFFMTEYINETKRDAVSSLQKISENKGSEHNPQQSKDAEKYHNEMLDNAYKQFDNLKNNLEFDLPDYGNVFYNYCDSLKIVSISLEEKKIIWANAEKEFKASIKPQKLEDVPNYKDMLELLENRSESIKDRIIIIAKKLALRNWFKKLINEGLDLKELIEKTVSA